MRVILASVWLLLFSLAASAQSITPDGNWWNTLPRTEQLMYVAGLFAGMAVGYDRAHSVVEIGMMGGGPPCKTQECAERIVAFGMKLDGDLSKDQKLHDAVTAGQLADGLSLIYSDYRNRNILVSNAESVAMDSINGASDANTEKRLEYFRAHSGGN